MTHKNCSLAVNFSSYCCDILKWSPSVSFCVSFLDCPSWLIYDMTHCICYCQRTTCYSYLVLFWLCSSARQRWNPVDGFSDRLLPSDRWQWSDVTGLQHQPLDSFQLPSSSWEWEGDWYADENFEGEPTEKGVNITLKTTHKHTLLNTPFTSYSWLV